MKRKILVTPRSFGKQSNEAFEMLKKAGYDIVRNDTGMMMTTEELTKNIRDCEGVIIGVEQLSKEVLEYAPKLKAIAKYGVGTDNIDMPFCETKGIKVSKTAGANSDAVADYAFALILACARKLLQIHNQCLQRNWSKVTSTDVCGKTLGILGMGSIGKGVIRRAQGFDMHVMAYDVFWDEEFAQKNQVERAQITDICINSDFISLHLPFLPDTKKCIGEKELKLMKPTSFLINTARGALIDEDALLRALTEKRIAGAGLDVFNEEPPANERWFMLDNVIMGSHCAASTVETTNRMSLAAAKNVLRDLSEN
jgi:phosphoglycerate dehydrogenase-like enzyme